MGNPVLKINPTSIFNIPCSIFNIQKLCTLPDLQSGSKGVGGV
jgi:hypothetical protein